MDAVYKIRKWLRDAGYKGVILGRRDNYTWATGGAQNLVCTNTEAGVAYLIIEDERILLLADSSDLARMDAEQNPLGAQAVLVPWYESMEKAIGDICSQGMAGANPGMPDANYVSDCGIAGTENVQGQLIDIRMRLDETELIKYREIGQLCAHIVEGVCRDAQPGVTESEVAEELKCRCIMAGISPDCVLVGADERISLYRHPIATDKTVRERLMVVLGGERYGLNISMTRFVYFTDIPSEMEARFEKTARVFAGMQELMEDGLSYGEYFGKVQGLYADAGYPDEWKLHHQGGPTGYGCREFIAGPDLAKVIHTGQAYAWNPTIQGTKCEETTYLSDSGIETFTRTDDWPIYEIPTSKGMITAAGILRV